MKENLIAHVLRRLKAGNLPKPNLVRTDITLEPVRTILKHRDMLTKFKKIWYKVIPPRDGG